MVTAAMPLVAAASPVPGADAATRTCGGKRVTIVGTSDNDHITGTRRADVIDGLAAAM